MMTNQLAEPATIRNHSLAFFCLVGLAYFSELQGQREAKILLGEIYIFTSTAFYIASNKQKDLQLKISFPAFFILIFFALSFVSVLSTENAYWSFLGTTKWLCFLIAFLAPQVIRLRTDTLSPYLWGPILAGSMVSLFGILNYYGLHFDPVIETLSGRGTVISTFGNPNYLSAFIGPVLPLCIYLILQEGRKNRTTILFIAYGLILTALLYARTRGVIIGLGLALAINLAVIICQKEARDAAATKKVKLTVLAALTVLLLLIFGGQPPYSDPSTQTIAERFSSGSSIKSRFMMWEISADMIAQSPLTGIGLGSYGYSYPKCQGEFLAKEQNAHYREWAGWAHNAHNEYLQIAAETGIPNLALLIAAICLYGLASTRAISKKTNIFQNLATTSALAVLLTHSLVSFPLRLMPSAILFWLMLGLLSAGLAPSSPKTYTLRLPIPVAIKLPLLTFAIVLSICSGAFFISDRYLGSGIRNGRENNLVAAKDNFESALALNPWNGRALEQLGSTLTTLKKIPEGRALLVKSKKYTISEVLYVKFASNSLAQGKIEEAISHYITGLYYYPDDYFMTMSLGIVAKMAADKYRRMGQIDEATRHYKLSLAQLESAKANKPLVSTEEDLLNSYIKSATNEILAAPNTDGLPKGSPPLVIKANKLPLLDIIQETTHRNRIYTRDFLYSPGGSGHLSIPSNALLHKSIQIDGGWLREYSVAN